MRMSECLLIYVSQVGQLGALLKELENKNDLRQHFKSVLKLDDLARWNKLLDAINSAVADDNRVRIFETKPSRADTDNLKLLFNAHQGQIVFEEKEAHGNSPPSIIGIIYRMAGANLVPTCVPNCISLFPWIYVHKIWFQVSNF